ncbi:RNA polymerase-associated protein RapA [Salinicola rhizosphaerae]|uniref:RNA polymerase-associated protein RapA n=1 Tax=Salinicola rhizosphaerae TaxID=1443141 RepID=A0ABQ3EEA7_9GAMM|nr:RNA polymerase-associated protein RapA [Salinicola rhizosphaerae]GHB33642.1 RNA polymerase-associated protein RapA [Salinicola rhizosphaerae]
MSDFFPGQRWISDGETELGLGTILTVDARSVTVLFTASQETRTYSVRQAPLTRVVFGPGDRIDTADGYQLSVERVEEQDGCVIYHGQDTDGEPLTIGEAKLSDSMRFHQAQDRLLTGQVDRNDWFELRYRSLHHHQRLARSPALGLAGPRIDLIAHQLYIADEVSRRQSPRVLLADEVGLGKTIEAGLILHRLLLTGRASRALILVPASLTHQWLIELLRRFSLSVTLLDEAQSEAFGDDNPFDSGQCILASQQWLFANPHRQRQAEACEWDLLIVDEAHHLDWSPQTTGPGYACIERLSQRIAGLLLLTATPEQMGLESHFARLRLLDPDRYHDLDRFRAEENGYAAVAEAIEALARLPGDAADRDRLGAVIDDADGEALAATLLDPESDEAQRDSARRQLREQLLDRHGTGRVMFRNSRRHVGGFPERHLHVSELPLPDAYRDQFDELRDGNDHMAAQLSAADLGPREARLYPEAAYRALDDARHDGAGDAWWRFDSRVDWLIERLETAAAAHKTLVIVHRRQTAVELAEALRVRAGIAAPVFHEALSLVERDRAAAAFAEDEDGCQVLICSEIGSEGRNFQFCHHLVMFDLPWHPDLLEQRIGRLDRIGQLHPIDIHVPMLSPSPAGVLLRWYRDGLDAFSAPHAAGGDVLEALGDALLEALDDDSSLDALIEETRTFNDARLAEREAGRNRLLEWNACRPERADAVISAVVEQDNDKALPRYVDQALDIFGVDSRDLGNGLMHLAPGSHMLDSLPGLAQGDDGFTATYSRARALARDDIQRLSWEHPLVSALLERVLESSLGNTALALLRHPSIPGGRLMVELVFRTHCPAPKSLQLGRFLPDTGIRVLLDESGTNLSDKVTFSGLSRNLQRVKKGVARELLKSRHDQLRALLRQGEREAERELPTLVENAQQQMRDTLDRELARLKALAARNDAIREDELKSLADERHALDTAIESATLRLDAVRVIVTVDNEQR